MSGEARSAARGEGRGLQGREGWGGERARARPVRGVGGLSRGTAREGGGEGGGKGGSCGQGAGLGRQH